MKKFLAIVPLLLLGIMHTSSAQAGSATDSPLFVKKSGTGFVAEEWKKLETCEVYRDRVLIKREFGIKASITSEEIRNVAIKGDYQNPLLAASKGKIATESMTVIDGPTFEYVGYIQEGASLLPVTLKSENGLNATMVTNSAPEAQLLINVLDSVCPRAFE